MKLRDLTPDHYRRSLGRIKHRAQRTLRDTWFHFRNGTLGRLVIVGSALCASMSETAPSWRLVQSVGMTDSQLVSEGNWPGIAAT